MLRGVSFGRVVTPRVPAGWLRDRLPLREPNPPVVPGSPLSGVSVHVHVDAATALVLEALRGECEMQDERVDAEATRDGGALGVNADT